MLVGDAAGLADPLTAEGISNALASGRLAAVAILAANGDAQRARADYLNALNSSILRDLAWARRLAKVLHHEFARDALFERFGAELARGMALSIAGRSNYRRMMTDPKNYWRLARRCLGANRPRTTSV
jgi:flavin-dependent dehydrogenase